jgi:CBS domain-containing protein
MERAGTGIVAVVQDGRLDGVVTERDVVRALAAGADPAISTVATYATSDVITASLEEHISVVARRMVDAYVRRLPVVAPGGEPVGVVSMRDLFILETLMGTEPPHDASRPVAPTTGG